MDLTELKEKVAETTGVIESAVIFIAGIKSRLADILAGDNHADEIAALITELDDAESHLAEAIATDP
jgi:uncharacterized protein YggU (UPF0235/DUF167 family)